MKYPQAFIDYLTEYHGSRDYFECHEILEEHWKEVDPGNKQSHWVSFILLAVSAYHHRRGNFTGAGKTMRKSLDIMKRTDPYIIRNLGLDYEALLQMMRRSLSSVEAMEPYESKDLPVIEEMLLDDCAKSCRLKGYDWYFKGIVHDDVKHRHIRRDRTAVIYEREEQMRLRQNSRN